jgi:hypothetical protein
MKPGAVLMAAVAVSLALVAALAGCAPKTGGPALPASERPIMYDFYTDS